MSTANKAVSRNLEEIKAMKFVVDQIDALDKLIIQYPREPAYWLARGRARMSKDFLPSAAKDLDQVVALDPEFLGPAREAMVEKATILSRKNELAAAYKLQLCPRRCQAPRLRWPRWPHW